jgi:hypothetical protein
MAGLGIRIQRLRGAQSVDPAVAVTNDNDEPRDSVFSEPPTAVYDIGSYLLQETCKDGISFCLRNDVTDSMRLNLLNHHWVPPSNYVMPYAVRQNKGRTEKRYLRHEHLKNYQFLAYSHVLGGLFCKTCVLFGPATHTASRSSQQLGFLVTRPLDRYDKLFGKKSGYVTLHTSTEYHKGATVRAAAFCDSISRSSTVIKVLDKAHSKQAEENRARLKPIVKTIILCGRQNMPLRGHRDDGRLLNSDSESSDDSDSDSDSATDRAIDGNPDILKSVVSRNSGNFRALLKFRIDAGDEELRNHLTNASSNATYISKTSQNQLIQSCGAVLTTKIVQRVHEARYFTILADETTDAGKKEELSISLRYVINGNVREDFISFTPLGIDTTGAAIAEVILKQLKSVGVDTKYMIGQGYDGASCMSGYISGVQACIRKTCPSAIYVHCASHCLNLTLSKSCEHQKLPGCC